jgi:hypothetical protein
MFTISIAVVGEVCAADIVRGLAAVGGFQSRFYDSQRYSISIAG